MTLSTDNRKQRVEWSQDLEEIRESLPEGNFLVPAYNLEKLRELIGKLNKRAIKLQCSLITIEKVREHVVEADVINVLEEIDPKTKKYKVERATAKIIIAEVRIHGEAPKLNGWSFIGTIQHDSEAAGNILRVISDYEGNVPQRFRTATPDTCEHCKQNRTRKNTYILLNDLGEFKQVGRTCLRDFLGHANPERLAAWTETLLSLNEVVFEAWGGGFGLEMKALDLVAVQLNAATVIRLHGWTSKGKAYEQFSVSTAERVAWTLDSGSSHQREEGISDVCQQNASDAKLAADAIKWARAIPEDVDSDYLYNLRTVAVSSYIEWSKLGIAASMIPAYKRAMGDVQRKTAQVASEWVGNVKERLVLNVKTTGLNRYENDFGGGVVVKMVTDSGSVLTWFASAVYPDELEDRGLRLNGDFTKIKATVKKHDEFRGTHQTVVNRVAVQK
jgi:hypothetical protein